MRLSLSRPVQNSAPAGDSLNEKIMIDIYLIVLEKNLAKSIQNCSIKGKPALLQQFRNVILRHTDQEKWKLFLAGVAIRKGSLDGLEKVQKWLVSGADNPIDECLQSTKADIESIYYSLEDQGNRRHYPDTISSTISSDEWKKLAPGIENKVRDDVMREFLLRITARALQ